MISRKKNILDIVRIMKIYILDEQVFYNSYDSYAYECRWNSPNRGGVDSKPPRAYQNQDAVPEDGFLSGIVLGE